MQLAAPADDTVIYQPTSPSPKHRAYYDRLDADVKVFIPYIHDGRSNYLKEWRSYLSIPSSIRKLSSDIYAVSSFDSLVFALLGPKIGCSRIETYDDGIMNVLPSEIRVRVQDEPLIHKLTKKVLKKNNNFDLIGSTSLHYTIYPPRNLMFGNDVAFELPRFNLVKPRKPEIALTVLLGTPVELHEGPKSPVRREIYKNLVRNMRFDLFLPHPSEDGPEIVKNDYLTDLKSIDYKSMIAEDVILSLSATYQIKVYGFSSSALVNMRGIADCTNIIIPGMNDVDLEIYERLGIKNIWASEFLK